jgi:hypothetical protein
LGSVTVRASNTVRSPRVRYNAAVKRVGRIFLDVATAVSVVLFLGLLTCWITCPSRGMRSLVESGGFQLWCNAVYTQATWDRSGWSPARIVWRADHFRVGAVTAALPLMRLGRRYVGRKPDRHAGRCRGCGYDLRATPGRCPE